MKTSRQGTRVGVGSESGNEACLRRSSTYSEAISSSIGVVRGAIIATGPAKAMADAGAGGVIPYNTLRRELKTGLLIPSLFG